jgi:tRNA threonylcarbamoyladenosine biosynthesis protein TsaE
MDVRSQNAEQTIEIGRRLGERLQRGDLVLLQGELGSGKTHLVKGIVCGLGSPDLVTSPSFVLINEYRAGAAWQGMPIYHADLYRIEDPAELAGIGLDELWTTGAVCLVEWGERAADRLPAEYLTVRLENTDEVGRMLRLLPTGSRYHHLIAQLEPVLKHPSPDTQQNTGA